MRKIMMLLILIVFFSGGCYKFTFADEQNSKDTWCDYEEYVDYKEIDLMLEKISAGDKSFEQYVNDIREDGKTDINSLVYMFMENLKWQINSKKNSIISIFVISVISGLCISFFKGTVLSVMGESAVTLAYMLIGCTTITMFSDCYVTAYKAVNNVKDFMKVLYPAYASVTAFCTGNFTAMGYVFITMLVIGSVNVILVSLVMPVIRMYMVISICGNFMEDNRFSKLSSLMNRFVIFMVKTMIVIICATSIFQKMILPYKDMAARQTMLCAVKSIPAAGSTVSGLSDFVFASSILLRNSIGIAGVIIILICLSVPMIRVFLTLAIFNLAAAITQPVTDKRISLLLDSIGKGVGMLMMVMLTSGGLFMISLAIVSM